MKDIYTIMNRQNILNFYGSKLDLKLDSSELYDYQLTKNEDDYDVNLLNTNIPLLIHCVYKVDDPHGFVYAGVSEEVVKMFTLIYVISLNNIIRNIQALNVSILFQVAHYIVIGHQNN